MNNRRKRPVVKKIRLTVDLDQKDDDLMNKMKDMGYENKANFVRKAIKILASVESGETYLTTPNGERIPNSVIFS